MRFDKRRSSVGELSAAPVSTSLSERRRLEKRARRRLQRKRRLVSESLEPRRLLAADLIFTEVMYHAASHDPMDDWLELYNRGDETVDLEGFRISSGVEYTFHDATIGPGDYLVVAANVESFSATYPDVTNVVGGWTGRLSNRGELVRIRDQVGTTIDEFTYADSGDFAVRRSMPIETDVVNIVGACNGAQTYDGWVWEAPHDGEGSSLEVINEQFTNDLPQNWGTSVSGGTPGTDNSVSHENIAPTVSNVAHFPVIPKSSDGVTITAAISDDHHSPVRATLHYRVSSLDSTAYTEASMLDDGLHGDGLAGDGVYGADIPSQANDAVVEFYISAADQAGFVRTYPAPTDDQGGQGANMLYQVDDTDRPDDLVTYRVVMTVPAQQRYEEFEHRCSDAQRNATIVATSGTGVEVRYNAGVRYRGSDSRASTPPNTRFNFPSDRPLFGNTSMNINGNNEEDQVAGSALWALAGEPAADAWAVRMYQNNNDTSNGRYFAQVEVTNSDWARRHFPNDDQGNYYRGRRANEGPPGGQGATLEYFGEETLPYTSYLKGTNRSEANWDDIIQLTRSLDQEQTPDDVFLDTLAQIMDIDQWLKGMALSELTGYNEYGLFIGDARGDDWALYSGVNDPRFVFVPYDMDTMFEGRTGSIYSAENVPPLNRLLNAPGIWQRFYQQFLDVMEILTADNVGPHLTQLLGTVENERTIDGWVDFLHDRADYVDGIIQQELTATSSMNDAGGVYTTPDATSGRISGRAHAAKTHSVRVNGINAPYDARGATWSVSDIPLDVGMNRVLIQALDAEGREVERTYLDVYREGATTLANGVVDDDTTWTVANSPYVVTGDVTVDVGATLTIEPGVSVLFRPGTRLVVNGRLAAIGNESNPIRLTRDPLSGGSWNGIQFIDTMEENQIHWATLQWGITADGMIGLEDSRLEIDSTTFDDTNRRRIRTRDSSLVVRNSTFAEIIDTIDNQSEHVWGGGIPTDGEFVLENNVFGHITGHNDSVDFDAPRLPNPIPRILNNTFQGGGDDALDLTGDNWIEGNTFRNFIKDELNTDPGESNTISSSQGTFYVVRNIFENVQHATLVKENAFTYFLNNTVINSEFSAIYFDLPGQTSGPGQGATVEGSIFHNVAHAVDLTYRPTDGFTVDYSLLPADEVDLGTNNQSGIAAVVDLIGGDFSLLNGSGGQATGRHGIDMGAAIPVGALVTGEPQATTRSTSATLHVGGAGITHYRYQLNDGPFSDETPVETPITLRDLEPGPYVVRVIGKNLLGQWQDIDDANASQEWTVGSDVSRLIINEVLASNATAYALPDGRHPDFIELFNDSRDPIDLAGLTLTDDPDTPDKFVFPQGTVMGPGEYLTVNADERSGADGLFAGFTLRSQGEGVYLFESTEDDSVLLDSIEFGIQATDWSLGRGRHSEWTLNRPTPGGENNPVTPGDPSRLQINEWLAIADVTFSDDYIEIFNPLPTPADMGGLFLTDNSAGWPDRHRIAAYSYVPANGLALLLADNNPEDGPNHLDFGLNPRMETIAIHDSNLNQIDMIRYTPQFSDVSEGRSPNGSETITRFTIPNPLMDNPGSVTVTVAPIQNVTDIWRFDDSGADLGDAWRSLDYDDTAWAEGGGLFYNEGSDLPAAKTTPLTLGNITYYFRKTLTLDVDLDSIEEFLITTIVDDGFVFYVNGVEAQRVGMPNGPVTSATLANRTVGNAQPESFSLPTSAFAPGENRLAVEVHQASEGSSDIVFGLEIDARLVTSTESNRNETLMENLRISEVMYKPLGGSGFEFIELQNVGDTDLELDGVRLANGVDFTFGEHTLAAGSYVVVANNITNYRLRYGDEATVVGEFDGSLDNDGERIELLLPESSIARILDFKYDPLWYPETDGNGFSLVTADPLASRSDWREPAGWRASHFVNGSPGADDVGLEPGILVVNEVLANPTDRGQIELLNRIASPIDLSGWYLSDSATDLTKYTIPAGTTVEPNRYVVFSTSVDFGSAFSLNPDGGSVFLASPDAIADSAGFVASMAYGAIDYEASFGRYVTSDGRIESVEQSSATIGSDNAEPRTGPVVINEIMYRPLGNASGDGDEYIELRNASDSPIDLSSYRIHGDVAYNFPMESIPADGYGLVVGIDPAEFRRRHDVPDVPIWGPFDGLLGDTAAEIRLERRVDPTDTSRPWVLVEHVEYAAHSPWPILSPNVNASINRTTDAAYSNDPIRWGVGLVDGTPGAANEVADTTPPTEPTSVTPVLVDTTSVELSWTAATDAETGVIEYVIYRDGLIAGTSTATSFIDTSAAGPNVYDYTVAAVNGQGLEGRPSSPATLSIMSVESITSRVATEVVVRYTEAVTLESGSDVANYAIDGIAISAVTLGADGRFATLTTEPLTENTDYRLTIRNIVGQGTGQFPPTFDAAFQFQSGIPGFSVLARRSSDVVGTLRDADRLLDLPETDGTILESVEGIYTTINFSDDDGHTPDGLFAGTTNFPFGADGDSDNFSIRARGLLLVPDDRGGEWTFGATVALPDDGNSAINVIASPSEWKYLDDGTDQGTTWRNPGFDDSGWDSGLSQLGYGDGDETTQLDYGGDANNKYPTYYFRKTFNIADVTSVTAMNGAIVRDDGAAVYVNGIEVYRSNLADGADYTTYAQGSTGNENQFRTFEFDASVLVDGLNTIAVEVHQHEPDSSDVSFDMVLDAVVSGRDISADGFRLRIDDVTVINADSLNSLADRLGTVSLTPGSHEVEFVFFESTGEAEVELFAAQGAHTSISDTEEWRLVGDAANDGLLVTTLPDPPKTIPWERFDLIGPQIFSAFEQVLLSPSPTVYEVHLVAGHSITALASGENTTISVLRGGIELAVSNASDIGLSLVRDFVVPQTGTYQFEFVANQRVETFVQFELNTHFEAELFDLPSNNDSPATAERLDDYFTAIIDDLRRVRVLGATDGDSLFFSEFGTLSGGNVIEFEGRPTEMPTEGASVTIYASGDLGSSSEFITLNIEDVVVQEIFVDDGLDNQTVIASMPLTSEQVATIMADGVLQMTLTPSDDVGVEATSLVYADISFPDPNGDHFQFTLAADEIVTVHAPYIGESNVAFDILSPEGEALALATSIEGGALVRNFRALTAGSYVIRARGEIANMVYYLTVVRDADLDTGATVDSREALDISHSGRVVGRLIHENATANYTFDATAGDVVTVSTKTPTSGAENLPNRLDPRIAVSDGNGTIGIDGDSLDGRNATTTFTVMTTGRHTVVIDSQGGDGDYVLNIDGHTVPPSDLETLSTTPANGETLFEAPSDIVVEFSSALNAASLSPNDISVNGQPASSVRLLDDRTVAFSISATEQVVDFVVDASSILGLAGGSNSVINGSFIVDAGPPQIVATKWNSAPIPDDRVVDAGALSISVEFSEAIDPSRLDVFDLRIRDATSEREWSPQSFTYNPNDNRLSMYFGYVAEGSYHFSIAADENGIHDLAGNALDGEPNEGTADGTVTGDGTAGGDYEATFFVEAGPTQIDHALDAVVPPVTLTRSATIQGEASYPGDVDTYALDLIAGEIVHVTTSSVGLSAITLTDSDGTVIASGVRRGAAFVLPPYQVATADTYTIHVATTQTGLSYDLNVVRDGALEATDSTIGVPFSLDAIRSNLGLSAMSVLGRTTPSPAKTLIYGVQPASSQIIVLDPLNGTIVDQFPTPDALTEEHTRIGLTISSSGQTLLYLNSDVDATALYHLDPDSGMVLGTERLSGDPYAGLAFANQGLVTESGAAGGDDSHRVFTYTTGGPIQEFDPSSGTFVGTISAPASDIEGLAFDTVTLYVSTSTGDLFLMDPSDDTSAGPAQRDAEFGHRFRVPGGPLFGLAARTVMVQGFDGAAREVEPNDDRETAQDIDRYFSLRNDPNVESPSGANNSTEVPHARIEASADDPGSQTSDYYRFTVTAGAVAAFDIDETRGLDAVLTLYDSKGDRIAENDNAGLLDAGSSDTRDPRLVFTFDDAGLYFLSVATTLDQDVIDRSTSYTLNVSLDHASLGSRSTTRWIDSGAEWRYLDDGSDQGTEWTSLEFDDSDWKRGPSQLGYGDGDEATVIDFGGHPDERFVTSYFRRDFRVDDPENVSNLQLRLLRDDGAAVYLNGKEIARSNLTENATFETLAVETVAADEEDEYFTLDIPPDLLATGSNMIAVEVHQASSDSSDLSFDLTLDATEDLVTFTLPTVKDTDFYTFDTTESLGKAVDIAVLGLSPSNEPENGVPMYVELIAPDGQSVVAVGDTESESDGTTVAILGHEITEAGRYTIRVSADSATDYHLVVTEGSIIELEPNNASTDRLRSLRSTEGVHGHIAAPHNGSTVFADPIGDTFGDATMLPDIVSLAAEVIDDHIQLTVEYHDAVPSGREWFSYIELDLDQNPETGQPSLQNTIAPLGQRGGPMGVERRLLFFPGADDSGSLIDNQFNVLSKIPLHAEGAKVELALPLSLLGDGGVAHTGNVNISMVSGRVGDQLATDAVPDNEVLSVTSDAATMDPIDLFEIDLTAGETIRFTTETPLDNAVTTPINQLDPALELRDPSGALVAADFDSSSDQRNATLEFVATSRGTYRIAVIAEANEGAYHLNVVRDLTTTPSAEVVGRYIFYKNSAFDTAPDPGVGNDAAIAVDKQPLLPGQTATFANYTSFDKGINGIAIDVARLSQTPTAADFTFRMGNRNDPTSWATAPTPEILRRPGAGHDGTDRIVLTWDDGTIVGQWLQVTMQANLQTGLKTDDVFYFGNAVGESGDSLSDTKVNATDEIEARNHPHTFVDPAPIGDLYDYNRDKRVNATDELIARNSATTFVNELILLVAPSPLTQVRVGITPDSPWTATEFVSVSGPDAWWRLDAGPRLRHVDRALIEDLSLVSDRYVDFAIEHTSQVRTAAGSRPTEADDVEWARAVEIVLAVEPDKFARRLRRSE